MSKQKETRVVELIINGKQAELSLNQVKGKVIALTKEISRMKEADDPELYRKKVTELNKVKKAYDEMRGAVGGYTSATTRFFTQFKTIAAGVLGGNIITGIFNKITEFIPDLIRKNADLSDSFADVAKTTGLTVKEVEDLNRSLKQLDTRTSRKDLLALARDAGKLGITGKENILEFVRAADKINVALGEDLGEDAVKNVGKLVSLFGLKDKFGLEESMLKTASAMNELGMASEASEGFIVDFLRRMGGIAPLAGISIDQTMALGATLDALGQTSEVSSTALSKLFVKMATEAGTYAKIAGMEVSAFAKLMNENALNAFIAVLKGAGKTKGGIIELTQTLGDLGIEGGRATGIFGTLASNVDKLEDQMNIANNAFQKGTSITDEFNVKNNTLGASLDRLGKKMKSIFTSSALNKGLTHIVGLLDKWTTSQVSLTAELEKSQFEFNREMNILQQGNFTQAQRARLIEEINTKYKDYLPSLIDERDTLEQIKQKQEAGNQALFTKIMLLQYEKERTDILKQQQQALDGLYKTEKSRQDINLDQNTGFTPDQKKAMTNSFKAVDDFNQGIVDSTDKRLQELDVKFKSMAAKVKLEWDKIKAATGGGVFPTPDSAEGGGFDFSTGDGKAAKKEKTITLEEMAEQDRKLAEEQYKLGLELTDQFFTKKKNRLAQDLLDGKISQEEYETSITLLTERELDARLNLAIEYGQDVVGAEEAILNHKLKLMEKENSEHKKMLDEKLEEEKRAADIRKQLEEEIRDYYIQLGTEAATMVAANQSRIKNAEAEMEYNAFIDDLERQKSAYDTMLKDDLISQEEYDKKVAEIQEDTIEKDRELKMKQWKFDRELAISNSIIQTTAAVIRALMTPPGPPLTTPRGVMVGALGALQLGSILAQAPPQFYAGGITVTGGADGRRYRANHVGSFADGGYYGSASYGLIGERGPELVIPNWLYTAPPMADVMRGLEAAIYSRQFAFGGSTAQNMQMSIPIENAGVRWMPALISTLDKLNEKLDEPLEAVTFYDKQKYDEYVKLENKARAAGKF
jgi:TP901 family phage tail tape measure protein